MIAASEGAHDLRIEGNPFIIRFKTSVLQYIFRGSSPMY